MIAEKVETGAAVAVVVTGTIVDEVQTTIAVATVAAIVDALVRPRALAPAPARDHDHAVDRSSRTPLIFS